jgi:hypothetical protein
VNDANSRQVTGASPNPSGWPRFSDAAPALQVSGLGGSPELEETAWAISRPRDGGTAGDAVLALAETTNSTSGTGPWDVVARVARALEARMAEQHVR